MPTNHTVRQGDSTISLAEQHGFFADTIWNDAANASLREDREEMNVLLPGDVIVIPDLRVKTESRAAEKRHRYRRRGVPARYRVQLFDMEEPRVGQPYRFTVDGATVNGKTDSEGVLDEWVPPGAKRGVIVIGDPEVVIEVAFGHLDPIDEVVGVHKRLTNLGYFCGPPSGEMNDAIRGAIREFQRRFGLEETGEPDGPTLEKLGEVHDAPHDFPD